MFRLTREVRFAVNDTPDDQLQRPASNSFAGYPSLTGFGRFFRLRVTLEGPLDPASSYLRNIKQIDQSVRERVIPLAGKSLVPSALFEILRDAFPGHRLHRVALGIGEFLWTSQLASERGMYTRLSQKFEFSASHRLHNPGLSDQENRDIYGKCNHPAGHGHNYEVQVTLKGKPNDNGLIVNVPAFERIVKQHVIDPLDHKNLNSDVPEFRELIPTVENIAAVVYRRLKGRFAEVNAELAAVTVWETSKTWCEYSEE